MKIFNKIFAVGVVALAATSCMYKANYTTVPYVSVNTTSISVDETVGEVLVPVQAYNTTEPVTVTFTATGTAKEDVNYTIEGGNSLTLEPGTPSNIKVKVIDIDGYTGDVALTFQIAVDGSSNVELGAATKCKLTIKDKDFNYTAKWLEGTWKAQDYYKGAKDGDSYEVTIKMTGDKKFTLSGLAGFKTTLDGEVDFAKKSMTLKYAYAFTDEDGEDCYYVGIDLNAGKVYTTFPGGEFTPTSFQLDYAFFAMDAGYYYGPYSTVLSK